MISQHRRQCHIRDPVNTAASALSCSRQCWSHLAIAGANVAIVSQCSSYVSFAVINVAVINVAVINVAVINVAVINVAVINVAVM